MISYIRQHMIAFVALFIAIISFGGTAAYAANTIRSSDIVDGQVKNQDLADNAVGTKKIQDGSVLGRDIKDDSLSGANIKESTLDQVPDAKTIDGVPLDTLKHTTLALHTETDTCAQPGIWSQCDTFSLTVPAGHQYVVDVTSSITANPGATGELIAYCPAVTGPTCMSGDPEYLTLPANQYTNGTIADGNFFQPGTYTISTAVKVPAALLATVNASTSTTIEYYDVALFNAH